MKNSEVKQYLIDAAKWWITESDIDGYLLDSAGAMFRPAFGLIFRKK